MPAPTDFEIDGIALGMDVVDVVDGQRGQVTCIAVYRYAANTAKVESTTEYGKAYWADIARLQPADKRDMGLGSHASKDPG